MIKIPAGVKGLIFDLDGTIANTMQNHFEAWRVAVKPYGIDFNADLFRSLTGMPRIATIEKLNQLYGTTMNPIEVGNAKAAHFKKSAHLTQEIKVVTDVIRKYHTILPMSVGTGSTKLGAKQSLEITGMDTFFDIVITANDILNPKPHPETFLKCAELMDVEPKDCLVFEDGILGIQAAESVGMGVIDVNDYYKLEFTI
ncbi:HAD family hydrolase [Lutibacter citreus]|uniref:HAD family hydrolase n=1 Tax=Lutibacter citreus TaxID=2138210 RepID=UPI000DBE78C5|nr:beta-phosphoglucomutase family hydrolase [Lutibacter citreus]